MKVVALAIIPLAVSAFALSAAAQPSGPAAEPQPPIVIDIPANAGKARLTVTSADIKPNALIPQDNSSYGKSLSPQVSWTSGPTGTKSYAVVMEDADFHFPGGPPITHWLAFNIPAGLSALPGGLPPQGAATVPAGMVTGANIMGKASYMGPRTPPKATHHYHLQIVALDTTLTLPQGASRQDFVKAIDGHVVGAGDLVGLFTGPDAPPAPAK